MRRHLGRDEPQLPAAAGKPGQDDPDPCQRTQGLPDNDGHLRCNLRRTAGARENDGPTATTTTAAATAAAATAATAAATATAATTTGGPDAERLV